MCMITSLCLIRALKTTNYQYALALNSLCSQNGNELTLLSSWEGGALGGEVLLTKMPSGWLTMPAVRFMVTTMELPSNQ